MKIIRFILFFILFMVLFVFAYANVQFSEFNLPFYTTLKLPLIILLFAAFIIGVVLGILSMLLRVLSLRQQLNSLTRELKLSISKNDAAAAAPATTVVIKDRADTTAAAD